MRSLLRIAAITLVMLAGIASLPAQTVTVTSSHFSDSSGNLITGLLHWQPTLANGMSASYRLGGGGQVTSLPVEVYVVGGVLSMPIADTSLTSPKNICFRLTLTTTVSGSALGPGYRCLQPHSVATSTSDWCQSGVCNLDNYTPPLAPLVQVTAGPTGPAGAIGPTGPAGAIGPTGPTGATPTIAVGATSIGTPGSPPAVTNTGTPTAAVFNFAFGAPVSACVTLADGIPVTVAMNNSPGYCGEVTLSSTIPTRALNISGLVNGSFFEIILIQDGTGGASVTGGTGCVWHLGTDAGFVATSTFSLTSAANAANILAGLYDGTNCWVNLR